MKNKFKLLIPIFFLYFSIINFLFIEDFNFESKSIEIIENEVVIAKDGVKVVTSDGLQILASESTYNRSTKILELKENVSIIDEIQNLKFYSNNITYNKLLEKITSSSKTKIDINNSHLIITKDITFLRSKFLIKSDQYTIIKDKFNNQIKLSGFIRQK